jgi:hypothetical protein
MYIVSMIHTNDINVKKVALAAFPDYSGRKFKIDVTDNPIDVRSYWEGGSRNYFNFVRLDNLQAFGEVPQQSAFDKPIQNAGNVSLVPGLVCVEHCYFCGKDLGLTIMVHPADAPRMITQQVDLTNEETIVLVYTRSRKSSYAGISNYRYVEAHRAKGITLDKWEEAKASLIDKRYLTKAGALTNEGRNAIGSKSEYQIDRL